jgi:hypothetical protein
MKDWAIKPKPEEGVLLFIVGIIAVLTGGLREAITSKNIALSKLADRVFLC